MPIWKRNLIVCWFGIFVTSVGMSQIAPILPLYIKHLGVQSNSLIEQFSGLAFGVTFIILAIFSPIWGKAADKYGRKPMLLRASLGMAITIFCMGFARNVYELIGLRLLMGMVAGYSTACTTLIATQTDKENAGWALGTLSTAAISGSLFGPIIGAYIADNLGLQNVFFLTGILLLISFITTALFVQEKFKRENANTLGTREIWKTLPNKDLIITMFVTFFVLTTALFSIEPIITVYVSQLVHNTTHVALLAGIAFSASGLASIIAAPMLGRLSDKIGAHKVMLVALIVAGIIFIPQAFVKNPWQLIGLRFLLGLVTAGLTPCVNSIIKRITPESIAGRVYGFNMSAGYLGGFGGSILGGQIAAYLGFRYVFFITGALLFANAIWVYFKVYKKLNVESINVMQKVKIIKFTNENGLIKANKE